MPLILLIKVYNSFDTLRVYIVAILLKIVLNLDMDDHNLDVHVICN